MYSRMQNTFEMVGNKLYGWLDSMIVMLPNFVVAVVAVVLFYVFSRVLVKTMEKTLPKLSKNDAVNRLIMSITSVVVIIIGMFVALSILNLDKTVTSLLAGVGIIGLALGFAFQNAAANILSGVVMAVNSPINVGDIIKSNEHFGTVNHIGLRATRMTNPWGQEVEVPNRLVLQEPFEHYTHNGLRRVDVKGHVSLNEDLDKVEKVVLEEAMQIPYLLKDKPVQFFFREVEDFAIDFELRFWVKYSEYTNYFEGHHEGIKAIRRAFDTHGIEIPVPARFVRLNSGS